MPLSWNEIRSRSMDFAREWDDASSESGDAKSFWDAFFHVFGVRRRRIAAFEHYVNSKRGNPGFIDLFWPGVLIAEHKSRGENLDRAYDQALDYFPAIEDEELPRYVIASDFARFRVHDLETGDEFEFALEDLHKNVQRLGFIAGYEQRIFREQDPVNAKAADKLARLHDTLYESGYTGHRLEITLVRVLFCLFAEDTGIFMPRGVFYDYIQDCTREDGSDLGARLNELFDVLDTPEEDRLASRDERLRAFPHVNGRLFSETLRSPAFDGKMRQLLLDCCNLDWGQISPAIFGSLFQGIMDAEVRRSLGAHYTSEHNILKVIAPLFLDDLRAEFDRLKNRRSNDRAAKLRTFHEKLSSLQFFDPACGCGNFLVITYREIRQLELEVIQALYAKEAQQLALDAVDQYVKVDVDQFHGIEIEEWPAQIAQVAMWLMDHQMNVKVSQTFGNALVRIPLVKSANIVHGNALRLNWNEVVPAKDCSYLFGNPPFLGHHYQSADQKADHAKNMVTAGVGGHGVVDFVANWYVRAVPFLEENNSILAAFVSTNSITQGEQAGIVWSHLLAKGVRINFAHRTFQWTNEASGIAAVHCVIVGFGLFDNPPKTLYEYDHPRGEPHAVQLKNINPYLANGPDLLIRNRRTPLCDVPQMRWGNKPTDGGNFILSPEEKNDLLSEEPGAEIFVRRYMSGGDFINGRERYCLWLAGGDPEKLRSMKRVRARIDSVREFRLNSKAATTRAYADHPTLFRQIAQPNTSYLAIPEVSSEGRAHIPIAFLDANVICSNTMQIVPEATPYHFGVLSSTMHMAWMRTVCGRLKSDYRYSNTIVYNNFPWPSPTNKKRAAIEAAAQDVLESRASHPRASLADLYDPLSMPPDLVKAHRALDRAVDAAYGVRSASARWKTEAERVGFLFELYGKLSNERS